MLAKPRGNASVLGVQGPWGIYLVLHERLTAANLRPKHFVHVKPLLALDLCRQDPETHNPTNK